MEWAMLAFFLGGILTFGAALILALRTSGTKDDIKDETARLGGQWTFQMGYHQGYTTVILRLHEGDAAETRASEALGLAQMLVPMRWPDGWCLRPIRMDGWATWRVWELTFRHEAPAKLPMAPAIEVSTALDEMDQLLQGPVDEGHGIAPDVAKTLAQVLRKGKAAWGKHAVEDQL